VKSIFKNIILLIVGIIIAGGIVGIISNPEVFKGFTYQNTETEEYPTPKRAPTSQEKDIEVYLCESPNLEDIEVQEDKEIGDEEYQIYSVTLRDMHPTNLKIYAVREQTRICQGSWMDKPVVWLFEEAKLEVDTILIQDFVAKSQKQYTLSNTFCRPESVILISDNELTELQGKIRGSTKFRERYPDASGIFAFSRVGFNAKRTYSLVYFSTNEGTGLRGRGYLVLLIKQNRKWTVKEYQTLWIATS
jgi:hypothetical protein